jgi:undecaprenyl-diphosphatase
MEMSPDWRLYEWINGLSGNVVADSIVNFIANDYLVPVIMSLIMLGLWFGARSLQQRKLNQWGVVWAAVGVGLTNLFILILNLLIKLDPWPRPFLAGHDYNLVFGYEPTDPSFPANSAAVAFAFAAGVFTGNRKAGTVMYFIALLWGFSRVYVGIHYPLDILGGAVIAILITLIFKKALFLFEPLPTLLLGIIKWLHLADIPEKFSFSSINWRPTIATKWWRKEQL